MTFVLNLSRDLLAVALVRRFYSDVRHDARANGCRLKMFQRREEIRSRFDHLKNKIMRAITAWGIRKNNCAHSWFVQVFARPAMANDNRAADIELASLKTCRWGSPRVI